MIDTNAKLQDVVHLDDIDDEIDTTLAVDRIAQEKKLLRKIDMRMMPMMMLIYVLNYLDRNNIAVARLGTFEEDLGLHGTQYNTIISIFFVGYILTQIPTNMILDKVRPSLFLPVIMCCWGAVSACSGAVQNYQGMIVLRFLLGFVEAPFFPGSLFLFSSWYTKKELAKRISILYAAGQLSGAFGGLLGSAIMGGMEGKAGLAAWRWLFIIEGTATIPIAFAAAFVLPDYPETTKWLTEQERHLAMLRIADEANEQDVHKSSSREGLKLAFTDPSLYILWFMQLGLNTAASFTNFFPTIVKTLGYNKTQTLLLSAPPYVFAAILGISNSWHSDKTRERWLHVVWPQIFCSIGFIISATTLNVAARYTATFMMMSVYGSFGCILSWVSSTLPRPSSKRAVAYATVNAGSNLASIYASCKSDGSVDSANLEFPKGSLTVIYTLIHSYTANTDCVLASRLLPGVARTTVLAGQCRQRGILGSLYRTCYYAAILSRLEEQGTRSGQ
ncbi:MFS transporter [Aureobasidium sp. EXF-8845]|nr:MFS transporter [Aureobasidium sp. EXF-8845]KAI4854842.1 MFS transporter [Aureobasidium sp. EXF-8846]